MDLRKTSLGIGLTPASLPKVSNPKPIPPTVDSPRDAGGLSDGKTGGNFDNSYAAKVGINSTGVAAAGAAQAQEEMAINSKAIS